MQFNIEFNKKALERDLKIAAGAVASIVTFNVVKGVATTAKNIKQSKEIKQLKKEVVQLQDRVDQLEKKHTVESEIIPENQ